MEARSLNQIRTHPPQPSSVPVSRDRPARAFFPGSSLSSLPAGRPLGDSFLPWPERVSAHRPKATVEGSSSGRRELSRNRGLFDIFQAKTMVSSRRGFGRHESPPRNRAENSRLADAQALGRFPRTNQSVQDVCRTNAAL